MRKIFLIACLFLFGCYTVKQAEADSKKKGQNIPRKTKWLIYNFKMLEPYENSQLAFQDSMVSIRFTFSSKEIDFALTNKSKQILKILWDDASVVIYGRSNKIMHKGIKYADRGSSMASTTVLPSSILEDLILPTENVYYSEGYIGYLASTPSSWETRSLFIPTLKLPKDSALLRSLADQELLLYLPVSGMNNERFGYTFKFKVTDVQLRDSDPAIRANDRKPVTIFNN